MVTSIIDIKSVPFYTVFSNKQAKGTDMRTLRRHQQYFDFSETSSQKLVNDYRQEYQSISNLLDQNPALLELAHQDWAHLLSTSDEGRQADYTSENLLRALLFKCKEQESYRDTVIRIDTSEFLRHFVRLGHKPMMGFTLLSQAFCMLSVETINAMNQFITAFAVSQGKITPEKHRLDSTVVETNIHYPTDSSLLWDSFRTLSRLLSEIRNEQPVLGIINRFHDKKIKKLYTYISRNASSKSKATQRKVKRHYRTLIQRVQWIYSVGQAILVQLEPSSREAQLLAHYLPLVFKITDQADKRVLQGKTVPANEKLYSLFEAHTELIKRGKAGKPVEFGHKILVSQTGEKFIHHYQVLRTRCDDIELLNPALEAHHSVFGQLPEVLAADKGFYKSMDQIQELESKITTVSIAKKGRRTAEEEAREHTDSFKAGQRFRAGSEGSISVLKRAFSLKCCFYKGFKNYAASVGLAVLCHNLVLLTRL